MIFSSIILILTIFLVQVQRTWELICHQPISLGRPGLNYVHDECCPAGDPEGIPYTTEIQECCCGSVFKKSAEKECCLPDGGCDSGTGHIINKGEECKRKQCTLPPDVETDEQSFDCAGVTDGDKCKFGCAEGFTLINENNSGDVDVATCSGPDFTWDLDIPETICCVPQCPPLLPEHTKLDFMIVLDKSSSIGNKNFQIVRDFLHTMIDMLPMSVDSGRMTLITFNSVVETVFDFSDSMTESKEELKTRVDNIVYSGRGTFANKALMEVYNTQVTNNNLNRPDAQDVLLVITDGVSRGTSDITKFSSLIKDADVHFYCIGIGEVDQSQIESMASEPASKYTKIINVFEELEDVAKEFLGNYCHEQTCDDA